MKKIAAIVLALVMVVVFSATAFADGPMGNVPMGGPQGGQMQMGDGHTGRPQGGQMQMDGRPMCGPQGGQIQMGGSFMGNPQDDQMQQGWQQDNGQQPPKMPNGEAPQGFFEQNNQQPREMPSGEIPLGGFEQNGQQPAGGDMAPPQRSRNGQNAPMDNRGMDGQDPITALFDAVNAIEDETVKANIEALMQAEFDAIVAERDAEDKDAAAEAVAAAREALQSALAEAGIEFSMPEMGRPFQGQQSPQIPNK